MLKPLPALVLLTIAGIAGGWLIFAALARLTGADVEWWWPDNGSLPQQQLFEVTRSSATVAALFGGLYAVLYAYRKQRVEEAAGHRADEEGLSKRYQDAAEQLGHEKAAVRLAGVYSMARLADDWPQQRQMCIDVLCAYLRMPWPEVELSDLEVRKTVNGIISTHLDPTHPHSWSSMNFDLAGADLRYFVLQSSHILGKLNLIGTKFGDGCAMRHVRFFRPTPLYRASVYGDLDLVDNAYVDESPSPRWFLLGLKVESGAILQVGFRRQRLLRDEPQLIFNTPVHVEIDDVTLEGTLKIDLAKIAWRDHLQVSNLRVSGGGFLSVSGGPDMGSPGANGSSMSLDEVMANPPQAFVLRNWRLDDGAKAQFDKFVSTSEWAEWSRPTMSQGAELIVDKGDET